MGGTPPLKTGSNKRVGSGGGEAIRLGCGVTVGVGVCAVVEAAGASPPEDGEDGEAGGAGGGAQSADAVTVPVAEEVADVDPTELVFVTVTVRVDPMMSASFATQ